MFVAQTIQRRRVVAVGRKSETQKAVHGRPRDRHDRIIHLRDHPHRRRPGHRGPDRHRVHGNHRHRSRRTVVRVDVAARRTGSVVAQTFTGISGESAATAGRFARVQADRPFRGSDPHGR